MKLSMLAMSAALSLHVASTGALAQAALQQDKQQPTRPATPAPAPAAPPEMEDVMKAVIDAGTPGREHKLLDPMAGVWDVKSSFWMDPGAPPMEMNGKSTNEWIMGGRFLKMTYTGQFMGEPFEGMGLTGFNNISGQFETLWLDNMGTGIMTGFGSVSADGKTFTFHSEYDDPMSGSRKKTREVVVIDSNDQHTMMSYEILPNGGEQKTMKLVYTRAKK